MLARTRPDDESTRRHAQAGVAILWVIWLCTTFHTSTDPQVMGRYSARFFAALCVYLAFSLIVTILAVIPSFPLRRAFRWLAKAPRLAWIVGAALGGLLWAAVPMQPATKLYPSAVLLLGVWLLMEEAPPDAAWWGTEWLVRCFLVLIVLGLVIQLVVLLYLPSIHTFDEGSYAHAATDYLRTGLLTERIFGYPPRHYTGSIGSWAVTLAYWLQTFGFGWWQGRLYALLASGLALPAIYVAGSPLYDRKAGAAAAAFMALSNTFLETHRVRPDAPMLLMVSATLGTFLMARRRSQAWLHFLVGFLAALSAEAHLLALAFWGVYATLYGLGWLRQCPKARRPVWRAPLALFVAGSIPPAALYFVTHLLPALGKPLSVMRTPQWSCPIELLGKEVTRWAEYVSSYPLEAMLVLGAVFLALRRRKPEDRLLTGFLGLLLLAYVFAAPTEWSHYTRYFLPVWALLVGAMLAGKYALKPAFAFVTVVLLFGALVGQARKAWPKVMTNGPFQRPTPDVVEFVAANIPPGSTVAMNPYYYLYFDDGNRYRYLIPGIHPPTISALGGAPEDQVWQQVDPDIVVIDKPLDAHNVWMDDYLASAHFVYLDLFEEEGIEIYVPPDSPLAPGA